jgi:hypothetical protein
MHYQPEELCLDEDEKKGQVNWMGDLMQFQITLANPILWISAMYDDLR